MLTNVLRAALAASALAAAAPALAGTTTVTGSDNIYYPTGGGTAPVSIAVGGATSFTFSATGAITYNGGNFNDPDGFGSVSGEGVTGTDTISGITLPHAGALLGVFVNAGAETVAPASLVYADDAALTFASFSPLLGQAFFIGDGLTGHGTGAAQTFYVPTGATNLLFGFADAGGYYGAPGAYGDNSGTFAVAYTPAGAVGGVPEPATWAMMIGGIGAAGGAARRRRTLKVSFA